MRYPRWYWPSFSAPALLWLIAFFVVPFYAILAVAMGSVDPLFQIPRPEWNPFNWDTSAFSFVFDGLFSWGGAFQKVFARTLLYVAIAYPVAYFIARHAGRFKVALLVGLVAPFFISYLMRMLAWINLLQGDGWVNQVLEWTKVVDHPVNWLDGRASAVIFGLVYGYVPYMILPLYAFLDRIDPRVLEAARDLGANRLHAFRLVTLPMSKPAVLAGTVIIALPMFGDYYTPDLLSQSPKTSMIGNEINLYIRGGQQVPVGAALVIVLMIMLVILLAYYVWTTARTARRLGA